jgi:hypothetical protein
VKNLILYLIGIIIVVGALAYGASLMGVSQTWIGIGAAIVVGLGLMSAVAKTQRRD